MKDRRVYGGVDVLMGLQSVVAEVMGRPGADASVHQLHQSPALIRAS
jgi:hypothetical protein